MQRNPAQEARKFNLALLAIVLIALIPRLLLAATQYVEYDGYWHVWIAQQDRWSNLLWEYRTNAHPPLYFALLRLSFLFGRSPLVYRAVSLIAGAASVWMLGKTALHGVRSPVWAAIAALAYALAMPAIIVSNEVRTYMLAAVLVQVSFYYFLEITPVQQPASLKPRVMFAITAILACLAEYYALIYVGAVLLVAVALPLIRRQTNWPSALRREIATFALILALPVWEYISHFGNRTVAYDHLPTYYFQPDSAESAAEFLWRNLRNELNCFSSWRVPEGWPFSLAFAALVATAGLIVFLSRKRATPENRPAVLTLIVPLIMMSAIMAGSLARAYPFGGFLRQQYVLFPFFAICPFLLADRVTSGTARSPRLILAGLIAICVTVVGVQNYRAWPKSSDVLMTNEMARYDRLFPAAPAIYIDQFNLISFFMHHDDWKWQYLGPLTGPGTVDTFRLTRGDRSMVLFRDKDHWLLDLRDPGLYQEMAAGMRIWHLPAVTIFGLAQTPGKTRTQAQLKAYLARITELTAAAGLCEQKLDLNNYDVYAEFRAGGCDVAP